MSAFVSAASAKRLPVMLGAPCSQLCSADVCPLRGAGAAAGMERPPKIWPSSSVAFGARDRECEMRLLIDCVSHHHLDFHTLHLKVCKTKTAVFIGAACVEGRPSIVLLGKRIHKSYNGRAQH